MFLLQPQEQVYLWTFDSVEKGQQKTEKSQQLLLM